MENKQAAYSNSLSIVLDEHTILSTSQDSNFDELTFLTATICAVPIAYISILENNSTWIKARYGKMKVNFNDAHLLRAALNSNEIFTATLNENPELFISNSPSSYKFYAALILKDQNQHAIGILNILDTQERDLEAVQRRALKALANQFGKLIELEKQNFQFQQVQNQLKQKYQDLEKFASHVSHDIKSPLANIISLTQLLREENQGKFDEESAQYLNYLVESSYSLRNYVDGILNFYRSDYILEKDYEDVNLQEILGGIAKLYEVTDDIIINYPDQVILHNINKTALSQVFLNLISNGLKYNKQKIRKIDIRFQEKHSHYIFEVIDNGDGFPEKDSARIFNLFTTLDINDREGNPGSGIGLATVKKLVTNMGGRIEVKSTPGEGSIFAFTIRRY